MAKQSTSGSNIDYPVYQTSQDGQSYDELKTIYAQVEKTGQTYVDPDSLAIWAIKKGYDPNFGDPKNLQKAMTPGSPTYPTFAESTSKEQQNMKNFSYTGLLPSGDLKQTPLTVSIGKANQYMVTTPEGKVVKATSPEGQKTIKAAGFKNIYEAAEAQKSAGGQILPTGQSTNLQSQFELPTTENIGDYQFQTGDTALDDYLNNTILPKFEEVFANDPTAVLDDAAFEQAIKEVQQAYGPLFEQELKTIEESYNLSKGSLEAGQEKTQFYLGEELKTGLEEIGKQKGRLEEDVGIKKERIARNYQDALEESRAAFASRGLAFSGIREGKESKLGEAKETQLKDVELEKQRTLEDLLSAETKLKTNIPYEQAYQKGAFETSLSELGTQLGKEKQALEAEKLALEAEAKAKTKGYMGTVLSSPEFY